MTEPSIRGYRSEDWAQVWPIIREVASGAETYALSPTLSEVEGRAEWLTGHVVVALVGQEVLGTAHMGPNRPAQGSHVGTASFMVSGRARGRGVGRALGEYVVDWHRRQGFHAIQFNAVVETNVAAVALWRSLGFVVLATVPAAFRLPDGRYVGLHVMHLALTASTAPGTMGGCCGD